MRFFSRLLTLALLLVISGNFQAQSLDELSDSALYAKITEAEDTGLIRYYIEIANRLQYIYEDDSSGPFVERGLALAEKLNYHKHDQDLYFKEAIYYLYAVKDDDKFLKAVKKSVAASMKYDSDLDKIRGKYDLSSAYFTLEQVDSAIYYAEEALADSKALKDKKSIFQSYANLISYLKESGDLEEPNRLLNELIEFAHYSTVPEEKAEAFWNIATSYEVLNQPAQTLYYVLKAKDIYHELKMLDDEYAALISITNLYEEAYNFEVAIEYAKASLELLNRIEDKTPTSVANVYNNIGWVFYKHEQNDSALVYFQKSKTLFEQEAEGDLSIAFPIGNIGLIYTRLQEYDSAIFYSNLAMKLFEKQEDAGGMGEAFINIGMAQYHQKKFKKALQSLQSGLDNTDREYDPNQLLTGYLGVFKANKALKRWNEAIDAIESYTTIKDSVLNFETLFASQKVETNLAKDKDAAIILALETKAELDEANLKQQKIINYSMAAFALLILISLIFIFRNWRAKKKAYFKLNKQHEELVQSKAIIEKNHAEIEMQKEQIEMQHDDIIASIDFASRIQKALLKPEDHVNASLPNHFIYFKPRDIVSGDFYWAVVRDSYLYLAAADCTGHGVPGAMMSMLGIAFLNEIMAEESSLQPHEILDRLRDKVIKELGQKKSEGFNYRDGMDMSLIRLDLETKKLWFAGANNPLWICRGEEFIEHKGEKQAICYSDEMSPFVSHELQLEKEDVFYLFSDGYPDQFGGEKGKKLMYRPFKQLLHNMAIKPMNEQKQILSDRFEEWKRDLEQVDDVCVIGVRV